jgi:hypothetical protein
MNDAPQEIRRTQKRPISLFWALAIWAVLLGGLLSVFPGRIILQVASTIYRADEGFKHARRTINPEELRQWALQEVGKRSGTNDDPTIPASEIPVYIQKLYSRRPEEARVGGSEGQPIVFIIWGGGFFHWGINIGDTNFSEPYVNENSEYRYNFEWTNGIYYSRETQWSLW